MKTQEQERAINYWIFLIPFGICTILGIGGLIVGEIYLPDNAGGLIGRLAMYRNLGPMIVIWMALTLWSWHCLRLSSSRRSSEN